MIQARDCGNCNRSICRSPHFSHMALPMHVVFMLAVGLHAPTVQKQLQAVSLTGEGQ